MEIVTLLKSLSDENRLRILNLLRCEELCVCEIEYLLDISQSNASRHLNKLLIAKVIINEKKAQWVHYRLNDKIIDDYPFLKEFINKELDKHELFKNDLQKLNAYKNSSLNCENLKLLK